MPQGSARRASRRAAAIAVALTLAVGAVGVTRYAAGRDRRAAHAGWQAFAEAARVGDSGGMATALDAVLLADPADATALRRKETVAGGDAADGDPPMALFALRRGLRDGDLPAAARAATQWLRHRPKDWLAHCVLAADALRRGDRGGACAALDALPGPGDEGAATEAGGLLLAFRLFRALDRDPGVLRGFVHGEVCPSLKSGTAQTLGPADALALLGCYVEGFEPPTGRPQPTPLLLAWTPAAALLARAADEAVATRDAPLLASAGGLATDLAEVVAAFRGAGQLTAQQAGEFTREVRGHAAQCYATLREVKPKAAEAYRGLALLHAGDGRYPEARAEVERGLRHCENDPELSALFGRMLQLEGRATEAHAGFRALADREPTSATWWGLAVTAAVAAGRHDLALADCAAMRAALPGHPWAARAEAKLWLDAGDPARAAQLLHPLGVTVLAADAEGARLSARSLSAAGLHVFVPELLAEAERGAQATDDPTALAAALRGLLEANPDAAGANRVAAECQRFAGRWPEATDFYRLRAEALFRVAESKAPAWDALEVAAALQAAERWRARRPRDRSAAVLLVTLRLRSDDAAQVSADATPLRDAEADPLMAAAELEALGTASRVGGDLDAAARVLERLARSPSATPGGHVQLALTYHAQGKLPAARAALAQAQLRPRSPQVQADYVATARQLQPRPETP